MASKGMPHSWLLRETSPRVESMLPSLSAPTLTWMLTASAPIFSASSTDATSTLLLGSHAQIAPVAPVAEGSSALMDHRSISHSQGHRIGNGLMLLIILSMRIDVPLNLTPRFQCTY